MTRTLLLVGAIAALSLPAAAEAQGRGRNVDGVPPGHRPPPGMCRVWIDGVPPGRQPAPTSCREAVRNRPSNARVIYGDDVASRGNGKAKDKQKSRKGDDRPDRDHRRDRDERHDRDRDDDRRDRDRDDDDRRDRDRDDDDRRDRDDDRYEPRRGDDRVYDRRGDRTTRTSGDVRKTQTVFGIPLCTDSQGRTRVCPG